MTLKNYRNIFSTKLATLYPKTEIDSFFFLLIEAYLQFQKIDFSLQPNFTINKEKLLLLNAATEKLLQETPIQYILGNTEFYGLPFKVTQNTLIPRPETEELVDWVLNEAKHLKKDLKILDIGTGSGCIPISLKKHLPHASVTSIDVSKKALEVAAENAKSNNTTINFIRKNILETDVLNTNYDIIISNPPYVRNLEKVEIKNNVLQYEPHLALFVSDDNPLLFYIKIADLALKYLNPKGMLFFEINQYLGKETISMLEEKGFKNIELRKDFSKNNRMLKAL